jgi:hypothetical protein
VFASLAFDKEDVENQEWIKRRFIVLQDIFRDTPAYQFIIEEGREEERQTRLQTQRKLLLLIVQAHFPTLMNIAKVQAEQINNIDVIDKVLAEVGTAQTTKEVQHALLSWSDANSN